MGYSATSNSRIIQDISGFYGIPINHFENRKNWEDLIGKTFNKLTVIKRDYNNKKGIYYLCECECGNHTIVRKRPFSEWGY